MFYHLKIFLRTLRRSYTYSGINIAGLAIGMTASILIFLWVYHERSFDRFHPDAERIYRITNTLHHEDGNTWIWENSSMPFIQACKSEIPEIETVAVFYGNSFNAIKVNNTVFSVENGEAAYIDRAWLEMFHSQLVYGSFEAYGNHPFSVALTESAAKKYFGAEPATGQIITINNADYTVQVVVKDHPTNSSFRYNIMVPTDAALSDSQTRRSLEQWAWFSWIAFVKLRPDADVSQVIQKMNDIYANNNRAGNEANLRLLTDIHFETDIDSNLFVHGNAKTVSIFALLGILLLCTACINYINLTTARVTMRSKEVGVKKIVGAKRLTLFLQFVAESFIICFTATLIALILMQMLSPQYLSLVGNIVISFSSPVIWTITGITLAFVTILNGIYPALMLSSFQPIGFLKGTGFSKIKNSSLRKVLVVFQFTLSVALIISVTVIYKQMHYIQTIDPGYQKDRIVRINLPYRSLMASGGENAQLSLQTIKGELQSRPEIDDISLCSGQIENIGSSIRGSADWNGRAEDFDPEMSILKADVDFMRVFGLRLTEGRWFAKGEADIQNVILNETAVRELKIVEPYIGERFDLMNMKGSVIGVVKDFHFRSLHEKITPLVIYQQDPFFFTLALKINSDKAIGEIEAIWSKFFPNDPFEYVFIDDAFNNLYQSDIRTSRLALIFSILAILIALLGLFGLSTFAIERRTKEIGIRKVMGASVASIIYLLTREFLALVAIAFVIAAPVSWWAMTRWLENFAYRIDITVWIFVAGAAITIIIALIATGVQAIKAATEDPVKAISNCE